MSGACAKVQMCKGAKVQGCKSKARDSKTFELDTTKR